MSSNPGTGGSRRHILLVDRVFQLKYVILFALLGAGAAAGGGATTLAVRGGAAAFDAYIIAVLLVLAALGALALGGACVILTYRIAGPIFVMSRAMCAMAEGQYPSLRQLRTDDELEDFYELFAKSVDLLRAREVEDIARLGQVLAILGDGAREEKAQEALALLRGVIQAKRSRAELHALDASRGGPDGAPAAP
jgi:hypothetical protein